MAALIPIISPTPSLSIVLVNMKKIRARQEAGKRIGRKGVIGTVTGAGKETKTGTERGTRTVIVITEIVIGIGVIGGRGSEIEMKMIFSELEITIGEETMTKIERTDRDTSLALGVDPSIDQGLDHGHHLRAKGSVVLIWHLPPVHCYLALLMLQVHGPSISLQFKYLENCHVFPGHSVEVRIEMHGYILVSFLFL